MRKQWMLLVGIGEYADRRLASLPGVRIDIDLLRTCLEEFHTFPLGERIKDLRDAAATRSNILSVFEEVCGQAGAEDQLFVFLAGHGTSVADGSPASVESPGTTYFLPADTNIDALPAHGIRSEDIAARLRNTQAQQVVLVLDFCNASGLTFHLPSLTSPQLEARDWFVGATSRSCQSVVDTAQGGFFMRPFCDALSGRVQQQRPHISVDVRTAFEYATTCARASLAQAGFPQQPRPAQAGRAILLTTPPRSLVQQAWRNVLLLEDDEAYGQSMERLLAANGYVVNWLRSVDALSLELLGELPLDLAIVDLWFGAEPKGLSVVHELRRTNPLLPILVVTGHRSTELGFKTRQAGADDVFEKRLPAESYEFRDSLLARIDDLQRRQRDSDVPSLERRLCEIDRDTLYSAVLGPLYDKRNFVELQYQDVPSRSGGSLRVLCCLKDNGLGEFEGFGVYAVLDDISVCSTTTRSVLVATAVIEQLEDISANASVDNPRQGRAPLYRVILHCAGRVSPGAKSLIETAPSLHRRVIVWDGADLIGMLRREELEHRLAFRRPLKNVHLYLSTLPFVAGHALTWMDAFRMLLQSLENNYQLDSQRCLEGILERVRATCGIGACAVGACHVYEPRLSTNLLLIGLASQAFPWSAMCRNADARDMPLCPHWGPACGDIKLAFLSVLAGDEAQEHARQLSRIMRALADYHYRRPSHLGQDAEATLQDDKEWLCQKLVTEGFTVSVFWNTAVPGSHHWERLP